MRQQSQGILAAQQLLLHLLAPLPLRLQLGTHVEQCRRCPSLGLQLVIHLRQHCALHEDQGSLLLHLQGHQLLLHLQGVQLCRKLLVVLHGHSVTAQLLRL